MKKISILCLLILSMLISAFCEDVEAAYWKFDITEPGLEDGDYETTIKNMGIFISNFTELDMYEIPDVSKMTYDELVHFGVMHNFINNTKRIKRTEDGRFSVEGKYVAESVKKYFALDITPSLSAEYNGFKYDYSDGNYIFQPERKEIYYAAVKYVYDATVKDNYTIAMVTGEIYNSINPKDVRGEFYAYAGISFNEENEGTWTLLSLHEGSVILNDYEGARVAEYVNLSFYNPWDENKLPQLDSPASFHITGDYPRLDGATSIYPIYAAVANEVYVTNNKEELRQYLTCSRTAEAYDRLIRDKVDVIFVLQPSDEQLQSAKNAGKELHFTPIAKSAFVFFVNNRNPISGLSIEQIQDIYLKKITNWQEVGGENRKILPFQRPENSGSQTAMLKEVMKAEKLPPPLQEEFSGEMGSMYLDVAAYRDNEESIGYSFRFYTEEMMRNTLQRREELTGRIQNMQKNDVRRAGLQKALETLADAKPVKLLSVNGVAPGKDNIINGTYPFTVDLFAVTAGTSNPHVQDLIAWMLSPQGQELIEKTGHIGVRINDK